MYLVFGSLRFEFSADYQNRSSTVSRLEHVEYGVLFMKACPYLEHTTVAI